MILLPIGHERMSVRRLPWVTFTVMALCVLTFLATGRARLVAEDDLRLGEQTFRALEYAAQHPYLEVDPGFAREMLGGQTVADAVASHGLGPTEQAPPRSRLMRDAEQRHLDELTGRALQSLREHPFMRWGVIPGQLRPATLLSHMFLHAGWMHLLGNLLILYLAGPFVEDAWGRPLFLVFYVVAGWIAALFHIGAVTGTSGQAATPMVGASGAIAGVMGAFLVRHGTTRIRFFYLIALIIRGTFSAPAWAMLPLWFGHQLFLAMLTSELGVGAGVAYWAHVGGFVAGVAVAALIGAARIEQRFVQPALRARAATAVENNIDLERALQRRDGGDGDGALDMLQRLATRPPVRPNVVALMWTLADELDRTDEAGATLSGAVETLFRQGLVDDALRLWEQLQQLAPGTAADPAVLLRLTRALLARNDPAEALCTLRLAVTSAGSDLDPVTGLKIARLARRLDPPLARKVAGLIMVQPRSDLETRAQARELLAHLRS